MKAIAALSAGLACAGTALAAQASVELLPQSRVASGSVTLGQVARVRGDDLSQVRALVKLPIGHAPAAGQGMTLEREALAAWAGQRLHDRGTVTWEGPAQGLVLADSRTVEGEAIAGAASQALREWLSARSERSEVQLAWPPQDVQVPEGAPRLQARSLARSPLRSRMVVWVDVWSGNRFVRTVPVSFAVQAWREIPVAARPVEAGAPLDAANVEKRGIDIAALDGAPLARQAGDPVRATHALHAGEPLRARDAAPVPLVQRGQWASLRSGTGAVMTEARVEVLQDGRAGENVRVRQPGAMAQVTARVVGPGQLEIAR
ncbi:flagellar basal body P-ring formation chaperone FlgA [Ramlibacter humi]|uniref:Flagellar basal body P-ring formation protein FlgA n=1 Tax=Ramlibacter humi TaxID=2530451 RepID=A0A4Z0BFD1_9BURK|nr:flagellar basal body P-ring formation chaperone FlgA [Ramlibacter humi]TFY97089.1 flagellar basal body P-ring formation protein FlgA [Ramlibacter humi]